MVPYVLRIVIFAVLLAAPPPVRAERSCDPGQLFQRARFAAAETCLCRALEDPEAAGLEEATIHGYLAALRLIEGDEAAAVAHIEVALASGEGVAVPAGAPPRMEELIEEVRDRPDQDRLSLEITAPGCPPAGDEVQVRAVLDNAPEGLGFTLELRCEGAIEPVASERAPVATVGVSLATAGAAADDTVTCTASARTEAGAPLLVEELEITLCEPAERGRPAGRAGASPGLVGNTWFWVGIAVAAAAVVAGAAVGIAFGVAPAEAELGRARLELR